MIISTFTTLYFFTSLPLTQERPPLGYSIPLIDLNNETTYQVIVDKEKDQYLGHVTTAMLEDKKTIFAVYPKGHGKGPIVMKRSDNGGKTWSQRLPVPSSWASSQEVPTLFRTVDGKGKRRFIMHSGLFPIRQSLSEDNGKTWSDLKPIGNYGGIVATSSMTQCKDGSYLAMFHDDGRFIGEEFKPNGKNPMYVYQIRSFDGGVTWGQPSVVATHPQAHLCEPGIFRSPDGEMLLVLFRENSRKYNSFLMTSTDEGETWSSPREITGALTGDRHTGVYTKDGRLLISFRDTTRESQTQGDWVAWVGTFEDILEGREGQYRIRLKDNFHRWDCAYPGVEILPDETIVCTTYGHWEEAHSPYIISIRFKLDEIERLFLIKD